MTDYIMVPVAAGELYDKISILEIKAERIDEPTKLGNVHTELALLNGIALNLDCSRLAEVISLRC